MGNRLTKLYTKTGDDGTTGLGDGSRTIKDSSRIEAVGTIDELNSWIGLLIAELPSNESLIEPLTDIQHRLFDLGGELAAVVSRVVFEGELVRGMQPRGELLARYG